MIDHRNVKMIFLVFLFMLSWISLDNDVLKTRRPVRSHCSDTVSQGDYINGDIIFDLCCSQIITIHTVK